MNQEKNMDYQNIPRELFTKVQVDQGERERIGRPSLTAWQDGWIRLKQNKAAVASLFIIIAIVALAILGPVFSPYHFAQTDYSATYQGPSLAHLFVTTTNMYGRDQFTRIWHGTRISPLIGFVAACLDLFVGVTYGAGLRPAGR